VAGHVSRHLQQYFQHFMMYAMAVLSASAYAMRVRKLVGDYSTRMRATLAILRELHVGSKAQVEEIRRSLAVVGRSSATRAVAAVVNSRGDSIAAIGDASVLAAGSRLVSRVARVFFPGLASEASSLVIPVLRVRDAPQGKPSAPGTAPPQGGPPQGPATASCLGGTPLGAEARSLAEVYQRVAGAPPPTDDATLLQFKRHVASKHRAQVRIEGLPGLVTLPAMNASLRAFLQRRRQRDAEYVSVEALLALDARTLSGPGVPNPWMPAFLTWASDGRHAFLAARPSPPELLLPPVLLHDHRMYLSAYCAGAGTWTVLAVSGSGEDSRMRGATVPRAEFERTLEMPSLVACLMSGSPATDLGGLLPQGHAMAIAPEGAVPEERRTGLSKITEILSGEPGGTLTFSSLQEAQNEVRVGLQFERNPEEMRRFMELLLALVSKGRMGWMRDDAKEVFNDPWIRASYDDYDIFDEVQGLRVDSGLVDKDAVVGSRAEPGANTQSLTVLHLVASEDGLGYRVDMSSKALSPEVFMLATHKYMVPRMQASKEVREKAANTVRGLVGIPGADIKTSVVTSLNGTIARGPVGVDYIMDLVPRLARSDHTVRVVLSQGGQHTVFTLQRQGDRYKQLLATVFAYSLNTRAQTDIFSRVFNDKNKAGQKKKQEQKKPKKGRRRRVI
jgi:hypothetical protein